MILGLIRRSRFQKMHKVVYFVNPTEENFKDRSKVDLTFLEVL